MSTDCASLGGTFSYFRCFSFEARKLSFFVDALKLYCGIALFLSPVAVTGHFRNHLCPAFITAQHGALFDGAFARAQGVVPVGGCVFAA
jgi:hypothetical protein